VGEKADKDPERGGRHDFRFFDARAAKKSERQREEHTHPSHFASKHISTARIRAQMCFYIFAFGSLREASTKFFLSFCALFLPLSRISVSLLPHRLRRRKNEKIAKLHAPLLEEPNMVRAFALVDVEHKKLMVLI
jgi:hypothetical protein